MKILEAFVLIAAAAGGAAMVAAPENISDALHLTPDDKVALAMRVGGALVLVGAAVGTWRLIK